MKIEREKNCSLIFPTHIVHWHNKYYGKFLLFLLLTKKKSAKPEVVQSSAVRVAKRL